MSQPASQLHYERSTSYYYPDCDLIMTSTAQQIIYGMQEAVICAESSVVRDLLEAGRIVSPSLGKSDDNPLVLPYSKEDVEIILSHCFFPAPISSTFSTTRRLLQLCKKLGMDRYRGAIISATRSHPDFPSDAVPRILLAKICGVEEWFLPACKELLMLPVSAYSPAELRTIGYDVVIHLIRYREEMERINTRMLVDCPRFVASLLCTLSHRQCKKTWKDFWNNHFAPTAAINHAGLSSDFIWAYADLFPPAGMCSSCLRRNLTLLARSRRCNHMQATAAAYAREIWDDFSSSEEE